MSGLYFEHSKRRKEEEKKKKFINAVPWRMIMLYPLVQAFFCLTTFGGAGKTARNNQAASVAPMNGQIQYT